jgi:hypothetical protein
MTDEFPLDRLIGLVQAPDAVPPSVDRVEVRVRSDAQFLFRDPLKRGVSSEVQDAIGGAVKDGWMLGTFVVEWGFDVKDGMIAQFHAWLQNHEQHIVDSQPEGVSYRGTYGVFSTTEKRTGRYRTIWTFASFAGMQEFGHRLADKDAPFTQLMADLVGFWDRRPGAGTSQQIYPPAQGALSLWQLGEPPAASES